MSPESSPDNETIIAARRLGKLPAKVTRGALLLGDFMKFVKLPDQQVYWQQRAPIPLRTFGNDQHGDCTRAKQANAIMRMERLEQKLTVKITDEEVINRYYDMTKRLYGGGDVGAYEEDALSEWRKPDLTLRDVKGNPYTIDAFLRINPKSELEVKAALSLAGAKGIAVCFNLPLAWSQITPPAKWDVPRKPDGSVGALTGPWMPGSWGGHSMWSNGYDKTGIIVDHTWNLPNQYVTWDAVAAYMDEAYLVIDSVDAWRKQQAAEPVVVINLHDVVGAVNEVSSFKLKEE